MSLPNIYQEVEYIESTGTQYINLPFGFDKTDEIFFKMSINASQTFGDIFMVAPSTWNTDSNRFAMGTYNGNYIAGYGSIGTASTALLPTITNDGKIHNWRYSNYVFSITDLNISRDVSSISFGSTTQNLHLFKGLNNYNRGKICSYIHFKNNQKVIDLVPCYRKSDNVIGLYDLVNDTFYTNAGTGTFLKGSNVKLPIEYQEVEYIESTGTQYIDTGVKVKPNLFYDIKLKHNDFGGMFGRYSDSSGANIISQTISNMTAVNYGSTSSYYRYEIPIQLAFSVCKLKILDNKFYFNDALISDNINKTLPNTEETFFLFRQSSIYGRGRIYYVKLYDNNTLIRDFVPCYRKSDSVIGLYDLVDRVFYINSGYGSFKIGPIPGASTRKLEYLNETKELIKTAIIDKGQTITNEDPFRSYVGKINNITPINNWSTIGYQNNEPQTIINNGYNHALEIQQNWENVANLENKFSGDVDLQYMPLVDTSNATTMKNMFNSARSLKTTNTINAENVTSMYGMFYNCNALEKTALANTSNVTSAYQMFYNCGSLKTAPLFDTSSVTSMYQMFYNCTALTSIPLYDTSSVTNMQQAFYQCKSITTVPLLNTSSVTSMVEAFAYCTNLTSIPAIDTSKVTNMQGIFRFCENLTEIPLIDTSKVSSASYGTIRMFESCKSITTIPLINTSNFTDFSTFFADCTNLTTLPLIDTGKGASFSQFCYRCSNLTNVPQFDFSNATNFYVMFSAVGSKLTDESLNNIMASFIGATKYTGTKTLKYTGLDKSACLRCVNLSNYSDFIAAGWTTGY